MPVILQTGIFFIFSRNKKANPNTYWQEKI